MRKPFWWTYLATLLVWVVFCAIGVIFKAEASSDLQIAFVTLLFAYAMAAAMARVLPNDLRPLVPLFGHNAALISNVFFLLGAAMWYVEAVQPGRYPRADAFFVLALIPHLATWAYRLPIGYREYLVHLNGRPIDAGAIVLMPVWWPHMIEYHPTGEFTGKIVVDTDQGGRAANLAYDYRVFAARSASDNSCCFSLERLNGRLATWLNHILSERIFQAERAGQQAPRHIKGEAVIATVPVRYELDLETTYR